MHTARPKSILNFCKKNASSAADVAAAFAALQRKMQYVQLCAALHIIRSDCPMSMMWLHLMARLHAGD